MVINIRLADVHPLEPGAESMGRSWYGYDPDCNDAELWAQNRGRYAFAEGRVEQERFATLSYRGEIVVVASLSDWEPFEDYQRGIWKKALVGDVLGPGDPAYDALRGRTVPAGRSAFVYLDDEEWGVASIDPGSASQPSKQTSAQGWQSDPVRRKQVEDAAQERLMLHYRSHGWAVTDTRFGNPYDAVARRQGEVIFLEAKGTETTGSAVLVTSGEVEHALRHPGQCVMGVLSDIRFDADGQVDLDSGRFRMLSFEPRDDELIVTGYRWQLPAK